MFTEKKTAIKFVKLTVQRRRILVLNISNIKTPSNYTRDGQKISGLFMLLSFHVKLYTHVIYW
jgi:hypothetical protein